MANLTLACGTPVKVGMWVYDLDLNACEVLSITGYGLTIKRADRRRRDWGSPGDYYSSRDLAISQGIPRVQADIRRSSKELAAMKKRLAALKASLTAAPFQPTNRRNEPCAGQ